MEQGIRGISVVWNRESEYGTVTERSVQYGTEYCSMGQSTTDVYTWLGQYSVLCGKGKYMYGAGTNAGDTVGQAW